MIKKVLFSPFKILGKIRQLILIHKYRKDFLHFGNHSFVESPLALSGKQNISIGDNVRIAYKSWLAAVPLTGHEDCRLEIHDGCVIGHFNHIFATKRIILEKNVLTADKVYISDNLHGFRDVNIPIMNQPVVQNGEVVVGEGSWIGENVCVLGVSIGKHCVVGANSVVTHDIPDYCVAVGVPAKVIKRFNFITHQWEDENIKQMGGVKKTFSYIAQMLHKRNFAPIESSSFVCKPICMTAKYLRMGHNIYIGPNARIQGVDKYNDVAFTPVIELSDGVTIQQNIHLTCANYVSIGVNTAIAANVTITDIHHPYEDIEKPIDSQDIIVGEVVIGSDCKLYNNVVVLPNVHIGKHVTVGANSVVCSDLPSYSVAVGVPAYIIKRYCFDTKTWRKTDPKGNFID